MVMRLRSLLVIALVAVLTVGAACAPATGALQADVTGRTVDPVAQQTPVATPATENGMQVRIISPRSGETITVTEVTIEFEVTGTNGVGATEAATPVAATPEAMTTPAIGTTPVAETTPAIGATPIAETTPAVATTPVAETTPAIGTTPEAVTTPAIGTTPVAETTPAIGSTPIAETTPAIGTTPVAETTPVVVATPAVTDQPTIIVSLNRAPGLTNGPIDTTLEGVMRTNDTQVTFSDLAPGEYTAWVILVDETDTPINGAGTIAKVTFIVQ